MRTTPARNRDRQEPGPRTRAENLRTVAQIAEECPAFSEAAVRKLVFRAPLNGLEPAIVRIGRRVLIDYRRFDRWVERQRQS